jgi:hypothetical protein
MVTIKLPFGLKENNDLVHISDVENGKKCGCFCPSCRTPLIAVKGRKKQHHFRHDVVNECEGGLESAIHLAAKKIIQEKKKITLSKCEITISQIDSRRKKHTKQETVTEQGEVLFDSVHEEIELHGMRADILAVIGDRQLIIEVFYRHKVDDQKHEKIIKSNISAIEINLSDLQPENVRDWETFWACVNDSRRIKWLHNAKTARYKTKLEKLLHEELQSQEERYKQDEIEKREKEHTARLRLLQTLEDIKPLYSKERIAQIKQEAETHPIWKYYSQYIPHSLHKLPDFISANVINGDWIFGCDKRIWQTAFFISFICRNGKPFCIERVDNWLQNEMRCEVHSKIKLAGIYASTYRQLNPLAYILNTSPSSWQTLRAYFDYLCDAGMLEFTGGTNGNYWYKVPDKSPWSPQKQLQPNRIYRRSRRL